MPAINFLIKPASSGCNLRCSYCFYRSEAESRSVASYGLMTEETLENIVRKGIEYADSFCAFAFQGGEPTLAGLPFFSRLTALEKEYNTKKVRVINSIQTNGTLIDESWCRFLHDNGFLVGLSMDGPKEIHNSYRLDGARNGSFGSVKKAADLFDKYNVEYNILSVTTSKSSHYADRIYNYFKKSGYGYLQFINCLDPLDGAPGTREYSLRPADLEKFLKRLFDRWYDDLTHGCYISIRYFDNLVNMINGKRPEACNMWGRCHANCVIEADGSVYPCDFYAVDEWKLGNINGDAVGAMLRGDRAAEFVNSSLNLSEKCTRCKWYPLCRGGCRRECEPIDKKNGRINYYCEAYSRFFDYAYDRLCSAAEMTRG
jgi:uncharacterized protein